MRLPATDLHELLPESLRGDLAGTEPGEETLEDIGVTSMQLIEFATAIEERYEIEFEPEEFLVLLKSSMRDLADLIESKERAAG